MAYDTNSNEWQNAANQHKTGKTDNKTDVDTESVIQALSDLESGNAYSTIELYGKVVKGDLEFFDGSTSDLENEDSDLHDLENDEYRVYDSENPSDDLSEFDGYKLVDSDDLRSFVPIYNTLTDSEGSLVAKYRKQASIGGDTELVRRKIGGTGYNNWYFALVGEGDQ